MRGADVISAYGCDGCVIKEDYIKLRWKVSTN